MGYIIGWSSPDAASVGIRNPLQPMAPDRSVTIDNETTCRRMRILFGPHKPRSRTLPKDSDRVQACGLEWVWLLYARRNGLDPIAGWTDAPPCTDPIIARCLASFNDRCGKGASANARRLKWFGPLLQSGALEAPRVSHELSLHRRCVATDWSVRSAIPRIVERTPVAGCATPLRALPRIETEADLRLACDALYGIRRRTSGHSLEIRQRWTSGASSSARSRGRALNDAILDAVITAIVDASACVFAPFAAAADAAATSVDEHVDAATAALAILGFDAIGARWTSLFAKARAAWDAPDGDWDAVYWTSLRLARPMLRGSVPPEIVALSSELDREFQSVVQRMCSGESPAG